MRELRQQSPALLLEDDAVRAGASPPSGLRESQVEFWHSLKAFNAELRETLAQLTVKHEARIGDEITCRVKAERVGFHGYGMMLAEIGLPPGAEVDRASLETAMTESGWAISQYDILPDRVVVYLWPRAGGVDFSVKFRPRFALKAKSAPATVYDYYNPEARAVVAPTMFTIR